MGSPITTHILDISLGRPAAGVPVVLEFHRGDWETVGSGITDGDGRIGDLLSEGSLECGSYRISFDTGTYWAATEVEGFYPQVQVVFTIWETEQHYHVPLLLNPFGYSTYRGS